MDFRTGAYARGKQIDSCRILAARIRFLGGWSCTLCQDMHPALHHQCGAPCSSIFGSWFLQGNVSLSSPLLSPLFSPFFSAALLRGSMCGHGWLHEKMCMVVVAGCGGWICGCEISQPTTLFQWFKTVESRWALSCFTGSNFGKQPTNQACMNTLNEWMNEWMHDGIPIVKREHHRFWSKKKTLSTVQEGVPPPYAVNLWPPPLHTPYRMVLFRMVVSSRWFVVE